MRLRLYFVIELDTEAERRAKRARREFLSTDT
jgi:CRISPR/Cas system-associated protein endoribonuclease Cas2